jgi:glucose dehydrogenase
MVKKQYSNAIIVVFFLSLFLLSGLAQKVSFAYPAAQSSNNTSSQVRGGDWTSFIYDLNGSRYNAQSTITTVNIGKLPEKPTWFFSTGYAVTSTPVVLDGRAYVADWNGNVWCVFVSNGTACWPSPVHLPVGVSSTLAAPGDGKVYVAGGPLGTISNPQNQVFALNATTGAKVWNTTLPPQMSSIWASPIIYNGLVYIGEAGQDQKAPQERGAMYALNETTGQKVWNLTVGVGTAAGAPIIASVVIDPSLNSIYFDTGNVYDNKHSTDNNSLYAYSILSVDASSGSINWYYQAYTNHLLGDDLDFLSTPNLFTLKLTNGSIYQAVGVGGKDGIYYVLNRVNGALIEKRFFGQELVGLSGFVYLGGSSILGNPLIIIPSSSGNVTAWTPANNSISWILNTKGRIAGSVAIIPNGEGGPGAVLFGTRKGWLYAVSLLPTGPNETTILYKAKLPNLVNGDFSQIGGGVTVAEGYVLVGNFLKNPTKNDPNLGLYAFAPK